MLKPCFCNFNGENWSSGWESFILLSSFETRLKYQFVLQANLWTTEWRKRRERVNVPTGRRRNRGKRRVLFVETIKHTETANNNKKTVKNPKTYIWKFPTKIWQFHQLLVQSCLICGHLELSTIQHIRHKEYLKTPHWLTAFSTKGRYVALWKIVYFVTKQQ